MSGKTSIEVLFLNLKKKKNIALIIYFLHILNVVLTFVCNYNVTIFVKITSYSFIYIWQKTIKFGDEIYEISKYSRFSVKPSYLTERTKRNYKSSMFMLYLLSRFNLCFEYVFVSVIGIFQTCVSAINFFMSLSARQASNLIYHI